MSFDRIPTEMRDYPQWVVWKYEETDGGKPTKVPYSPRFRGHASVTNPATWGTYDDACGAFEAAGGELAGIGFVLTRNDPFGFIDLDNAWEADKYGGHKYPDPQAIFDRQQKVFTEFATYAEWSPSGNGLHLIVKTPPVTNGRKRSAIEVYTQERFMTMTGRVYRDSPIEDRGELYHTLWAQMGGPASIYRHEGNAPETADDNTIIMRALEAANGDKFRILLQGDWTDLYSSQSEADFAFVDILAFYTQNREQIERIFLASPLGQREKAKRRNYREYMINKSFDRQLPPVDVEGLAMLKAQFEAMVASGPAIGAASEEGSSPAAPAVEPGMALAAPPVSPPAYDPVKLFPPGLVGEIAEFIYAAAPRPVREVALVGAIGLTAGIIGRAYNVSGSGLNQYALLLAPTGTGKEAINSGISKLMKAVVGTIENGIASARQFIGPAEIRSDAALLKWLAKTPCFVSVTGEFGMRMKAMSQPNASSAELGLKRVIMDLWSKSGHGNVLNPMAYSDKDKNTDVLMSPAFSMIGESTPERFYEVLDEHMVQDGFLPRFVAVEYRGKRPPLNKAHVNAVPGFALVDKMKIIVTHCLEIMQKGSVQNVRMDGEAEALFDKFNEYCDSNINDDNGRETNKHLWNRAHLKAMKIAALVAVGVDPYSPCIDLQIAEWATALVVKDAENLLARFASGEVGMGALGGGERRQLDEMKRIIRDWSLTNEGLKYGMSEDMVRDGVIPLSSLHNRLGGFACFRTDRLGATAALKRTTQHLLDADSLRELPKNQAHAKYGKAARMFVVSDPGAFL